MAYLVELDVDEYGTLSGGEGLFPVDVIDHDWNTPYPPFQQVIPFEWDRGDGAGRPNVFWHPEIRDWVCDTSSYELLGRLAPGDVHTIAHGRLGSQELHVVQAVAVLDVVDREASLIDRQATYEILQFPAFFHSVADEISTRVFRVPGMHTAVFVGEAVKRALESSGTAGIRFVAVDWS